jgi:hypothetical protein
MGVKFWGTSAGAGWAMGADEGGAVGDDGVPMGAGWLAAAARPAAISMAAGPTSPRTSAKTALGFTGSPIDQTIENFHGIYFNELADKSNNDNSEIKTFQDVNGTHFLLSFALKDAEDESIKNVNIANLKTPLTPSSTLL